jgi:hypothetical protein
VAVFFITYLIRKRRLQSLYPSFLFRTKFIMTSNRVNTLLNDIRLINENHFALVQTLREIILSIDTAISEEVKYGGILFSAGKSFCGIFSYTKHVSLEFGEGAALKDPYKMLEGDGKFRRHIKLTSIDDIASKHVRKYLRLALKQVQEASI